MRGFKGSNGDTYLQEVLLCVYSALCSESVMH
jgi:hypothetical protein